MVKHTIQGGSYGIGDWVGRNCIAFTINNPRNAGCALGFRTLLTGRKPLTRRPRRNRT